MIKRYTTWLWASAIAQFLTAALHSISLFVSPEPADETQKQLIALMTNYKLDLGGGFHRSMAELVTALSSCFSFVCLLGGAITVYLLLKRAGAEVLKGITVINLLIFGAMFVVMIVFTFLPPIICTGAITAFLIGAWLTNKGTA